MAQTENRVQTEKVFHILGLPEPVYLNLCQEECKKLLVPSRSNPENANTSQGMEMALHCTLLLTVLSKFQIKASLLENLVAIFVQTAVLFLFVSKWLMSVSQPSCEMSVCNHVFLSR